MDLNRKIFSFDVFDTCISRAHSYPSDVFYDLGIKIAPPTLSEKAKQRFASKFSANRKSAEALAYKDPRFYGCPNIYEIYEFLKVPLGVNLTATEILRLEIEIEIESIYAISKILEKVRSIRSTGCEIIFISDMYLPSEVLGPIISNLGFFQPGDRLYVSCDVRLSKYTGNIYPYIIDKEKITAQNIFHLGDNLRTDIEKSREHGLNSELMSDAWLTSREIQLRGKNIVPPPSSSFLASFSRQSRLTIPSSDDSNPLDELMLETIAPFLISFVRWVLLSARSEGTRRLYFVSRDGEILYKIAKNLTNDNRGLELRYIYGSRKSWIPPSISPNSIAWIDALTIHGKSTTPFKILEAAGIKSADKESIFDALGMPESERKKQIQPLAYRKFLDDLIKNPAASSIFFKSTLKDREIVGRYFEQEGLFDGVTWALVDAGWALSCQAAVCRIVSEVKKQPHIVTGYYIGRYANHLSEKEAGKAFFFVDQPGSLYARRAHVVEILFTPATHSSTKGYEIRGEYVHPVFSSELRNQDELRYANRLHYLAAHAATVVDNSKYQLNEFNNFNYLKYHAANFLSNPRAADVLLISNFSAINDMFRYDKATRGLCQPFKYRDCIDILRLLFLKKSIHPTWLESATNVSPRPIRMFLQTLMRIKNFFKSNSGIYY